jgi:hypothetical protein
LAAVFALGFGAGNLLQNSYRLTYLKDAQANPDGGFPLTTGLVAATPALPWRQALQMNDLRNWVPTVPVQLCGGAIDPLVFWFNTQLMQNYWASHSSTASISVLDLESVWHSQTKFRDREATARRCRRRARSHGRRRVCGRGSLSRDTGGAVLLRRDEIVLRQPVANS